MLALTSIVALAAAVPGVFGTASGFNYGSTKNDGTPKYQSDFETAFTVAAGLDGTDGEFTSARLYTMIQGGTTNDVISAIPAAISTKTSLLLGIWVSGGASSLANELVALKSAISTYGSELADLVVGISVGSEDLYRISVTGIERSSGNPGVDPTTLVDYISQVREAISGTALSGASIGHVDTWDAWTNGTNSAVIDAIDWLGVDAYPYFETSNGNDISNGAALLDAAISKTSAVAGGKSVWITETGWPVSGDVMAEAVPSIANAKTFWDEAGCPLFGEYNVWWYTLQDADTSTPNPSFGIVGSTLSTTPLYDLSCSNKTSSTSSSASASATSTASSSSTKGSSGSSSSATTTAAGSTTTLTGSSGSGYSNSSSSGSSGSGSSSGSSGSSGSGSSSGSSGSGSSGSSGSGSGSGSSYASSGVGYNSTVTATKGASGAAAASGAAGSAGSAGLSATTSTAKAAETSSTSTSTSSSASASSSVVISGSAVVSGSISAMFAAAVVAMLAL